MRGIVLGNQNLEVRGDLAEPSCGEDELLVKVLAVGVCGTDMTLASGRRGVPTHPWVLGHEAVGEVVQVGAKVDGWKVGERAVLEPNIVDLTCDECRRGQTSACEHRKSSGVLTQPGFMQEKVNHPAEFCYHVPDDVDTRDAVCTEPMTVAGAAIRRAGITPGDKVLVLGAGAQGLFATQILAAKGIHPAIVDLDPDRVALAKQQGAVEPSEQDRDYDHVLDTTGAPAAMAAALAHLAQGAKITIVGESSKPLQLSSQDLVQHQLDLVGSFIYDHPVDFDATLELIDKHDVAPQELLAEPMTMEQAVDVLSGRSKPTGAGKPWITLA